MRKRNCDKLFDNIFWYSLYLLPVIILIGLYFSVYRDSGTLPSAMEIIQTLAFSGEGDFSVDIFTSSLVNLATEYFFEGNTNVPFTIAMVCMGHFVTVYIFHLFVDFLLFIPRLAHKWMNDFTQGD